MKPSLGKLHKFFKLESERGYDNRAVVGGLERILESWQAEAQIDNLPEEFIQAIITRLRDYDKLSPYSRYEVLDGLWKRIQRDHPDDDMISFQLVAPVQNRERETAEPPSPPKKIINPKPPHAQALTKSTHEDNQQENRNGSVTALNAPTSVLPGVGPRHAQTLARLGLYTLGDMLYYFPRRYDDYTQLKPINRLQYGEEVTVIGTIDSVTKRTIRRGANQVVECMVSDGTGSLRITWFNQPWIAQRLHIGTQIVLSGKIDQYLGRQVMNGPEWEPLEQQNLHTNRIVPIYPLTANITQRWLRKLLYQVVTYWAPRIQDYLPRSIRTEANLPDLSTALLQTHFPDSQTNLDIARQRLAFDEIFLIQLGVLDQKQTWQNRTAQKFEIADAWLDELVENIPYRLTNAQLRALRDIRTDLSSGRPMNRLLQGDVGSGKTVLAAFAIAIITSHNSQACLMAPTSILAEQHYRNLLELFTLLQASASNDEPIIRSDQICLLVGATPESEKFTIKEAIASGQIKLIIGTHALLEDPVIFSDLQLAVIDEQHRFGVEQRSLLRAKGKDPHLLVMTATPIPRSLALTVYGDLDLTVIDEMPPGRLPVETKVFFPRERERAYSLIRYQIKQGHQAFIIYPLIEETDKSDTKAAVDEFARLQSEIFPKLKLGLLHGRMKPDEKEAVMGDFRDGNIHILVSTSVVEVGVDVPNATLMLIEGANRFGLAQLHQFRGRVGRSTDKAYCILIPDTPDEIENERLQAMAETTDGFILAERDLQQRGPGDFLGTRQSGFAELHMASLTDLRMIELARFHALNTFNEDPHQTNPEYQLLYTTLKRFWGGRQGDIS